MSELPEDVLAVAGNVRAAVFNAMHDDDGRLTDPATADEIIARAIMAERERCAQVALACAIEINGDEPPSANAMAQAYITAHEIRASVAAPDIRMKGR